MRNLRYVVSSGSTLEQGVQLHPVAPPTF